MISIIIGGSNNHYNFSEKEVKNLIKKINIIKMSNTNLNMLIIFSRRSTEKIKSMIKDSLDENIVIWDKNFTNPYSFALKYSSYFIVTSDSTSMISECAYTGKPIYIFHLPFKRISKRIKRFHEKFDKLNITKDVNLIDKLNVWTYKPLDESKRIASIIKKRIIKEGQ